MKIHCQVNLVVKIENPSSNLLEICRYISSFYTAAWSRQSQRSLSCWSWHGRNVFRLLINRTWKLLAKVFKWSPIVCLLLLTAMKNPEKYECGLKYPNARDSILPCGSGPASGRFPEFCRWCGRLPHKTCNCSIKHESPREIKPWFIC